MDILNLMYRYINRFINSDKLLIELENIDLSNYSKSEIKDINKLILDIKDIKNTIPNEIDEVEKMRISKINNILELLDRAKNDKFRDAKELEFIDKKYNQLLSDKKTIHDGGRLYKKLFKLLTNNSIVRKYAKKMNNEELLKFITKYIYVPMPPEINQKSFNRLARIGIKNDKRESLFRLAFNYNRYNMDFSLIEDYFIEVRDSYYLTELICAVEEDLDINKLIGKVIYTNDNVFINDVLNICKDRGTLTQEDIDKLTINY